MGCTVWALEGFAKHMWILGYLTFKSLAVSLRSARCNIQKFYMVLTLRWVFCTNLRTGSGLCCIHH